MRSVVVRVCAWVGGCVNVRVVLRRATEANSAGTAAGNASAAGNMRHAEGAGGAAGEARK